MEIVMVPVPTELVADVDALLFRLRFQANAPSFDHEAMGEHLLMLSEEPRAVLLEVAAGVLEGRPRSDTELVAQFGVTLRELFGIVTEINDVTVRPLSSNLVYPLRAQAENDPATAVRQLHMLQGYALMATE